MLKLSTLAALSKYPGLLSYYQNAFTGGAMSITDQISTTVTPITRRTDFIGYNFIDPLNIGLYNLLTLCTEGKVYNAATLSCISKYIF